jgi:hypothetical protein
MKGKISIVTSGALSAESASKITHVISSLGRHGIATVMRHSPSTDEKGITIKIEDIGDISEQPIREIIGVLYPKKHLWQSWFGTQDEIEREAVTVKLQEGEKTFALPAEDGECIDWFIVEK